MNSPETNYSSLDDNKSLRAEYRDELMKRIIRYVKYTFPIYLALGGGLFIYVDIFISKVPQGPYWRAPSLILAIALLFFVNTRLKSKSKLIYYAYFCSLFSLSLMMSGLAWSVFDKVPFSRAYSGLLMGVFIVYIGSSGGYKMLAILYSPLILLPIAIIITYQASIASILQYLNVYALIITCLIASQVNENLRFREFRNRKIAEHERNNANKAYQKLTSTQAQLIQKEKLASLGELTAGIAHEIQNPLNFVNNFSEVSVELLSELTDELDRGDTDEAKAIADDVRQNLQKIRHHGGRAASIVRGMLEHSRTESGEKRPTDLNALVDEYLKIAYHGLRAKHKNFNVELVTDFDADLGRLEVAPQEIGRVLLNLYNNAFYAVSERAKQSSNLDYKPTVEVCTMRDSNPTAIQVGDNGTGIPDSLKAKIFQAFFTTKPTGEGTGLGLSLSYDIITKGHSGTLTVESQ